MASLLSHADLPSEVPNDDHLVMFQSEMIGQTLRQKEIFLSGCRDCRFKCSDQYDRIFNKSDVNIYVTFGYMDSMGGNYGNNIINKYQSIDRSAKNAFISQIVKSCNALYGACGFKAVTDHPNKFTKSIYYRDHSVNVNLYIQHSSYSIELSKNTSIYKKEQQYQTQLAENNFYGSMEKSDISIYLGHARAGGGPDFTPPVLDEHGKTDYYGFYKKNTPGLKKLTASISDSSPVVLAIMGCKSEKLFADAIANVANKDKLTLITNSDVVDMISGLQESYLVLDGLLRMECSDTFSRSLNLVKPKSGSKAVINDI